jgi:hypothetical protein
MGMQPMGSTVTAHAAECGWRSWAVVEKRMDVVLEALSELTSKDPAPRLKEGQSLCAAYHE